MSLLPFENLPVYKPRRFVPAGLDWGDWSRIEPLYDQLTARAGQ
jgi:oligoendopeptidase F